ncbi:putative symporter YagG [Falsiruegeria litorea R37]|uniref:Putative symporter YagG n=1 Tax=Falsiruegeria litorea R37 TaxID=1200284 RepID=A0A1Y5T8Y2_9RHOB|nr:MFS transporter [Falsiruegeria litorea]SLN56666.1 putative symporter YagG [Falsiruegeria litorea R37]
MQRAQVSLFSMALAAAGLPLYIHLPRFASSELGLSLATIGLLLIGIRVLDFVQDPALGWVVDRWPSLRKRFATLALSGMAVGFLCLFTLTAPIPIMPWLVTSLVLLFTAYSLGSILFYGQTVALAGGDSRAKLYELAGYREGGAILGIILATTAPTVLLAFGQSYAAFGVLLCLFLGIVALTTRGLWSSANEPAASFGFADLKQPGIRQLLALALINSLPVAITSTLFLFFVEDRLQLTDLAGPFLLLFFVASGLSVPIWTRLVRRHSARRILIPAMSLAILSFVGAALLPAGAALPFALICIASGAALGADMVILPILFASTLQRADLKAGQAFGIWSFTLKMSLALAAALVLPYLSWTGFEAGQTNTPSALSALNFAYAVLPCLIKAVAIWFLFHLPPQVMDQ